MSQDYVLEPFQTPIELHIDYARELNEQQLAAVTAPPGPSLVIAGAGSGKTRTLIFRVAYLLEQGIPPERILLLTFTNKAAQEMMRRVAELLGYELAPLWGGTFHAIGNRILRQHAPLLGFQRDYSILDREDARHLITACVAESGFKSKAAGFPKSEVLAEVFSLAVNTHKPVEQILREQGDDFTELAPQVIEVGKAYARRKLATNVMDFDDLLALWLRLLQEHQDVRELYQRRFQFILVDEYQDTNKLQGDLIDLMAARHHNVMVVGDDAQSIYAWRGANFQNILQFPARYPQAKLYKIETNYRSTPEILRLANAAIKENVQQYTKQLAPARRSGPKPALVACNDAGEQAAFVSQRLLELREEGTELNKIAVLYRSHFHALELQLELTRRNIPFSITSGIRFFEQAHIKDATAYLKLVANPRDELAFKRIVQLLPGVGPKAADKLWQAFDTPHSTLDTPDSAEDRRQRPEDREQTTQERRSHPSIHQSTDPKIHAPSPLARRLQGCSAEVPKKATAAWAQLTATFAELEQPECRANPGSMIEHVLKTGYADYLHAKHDNYESRTEDLEQLATFSRQLPGLDEFLSELALLTNIEAEVEQPTARDGERVRLSTIHQAKGLEFEVVFLIMLCEGLFPSSRTLKSADGLEEERRLLYVAITRARNELYLSYPYKRAGFGDSGPLVQHRSRFLDEIPGGLINFFNLVHASRNTRDRRWD